MTQFEFRKVDGQWQRRRVWTKKKGKWLTLVSKPKLVVLPKSRVHGCDVRKGIPGEFMTTDHVWR